jgi:hypothetical protein
MVGGFDLCGSIEGNAMDTRVLQYAFLSSITVA